MSNRLNISPRLCARIILCAIVFVIVAFAFAGEKIAVNDGIGWDGGNYLQTMRHFSDWIFNHGYDQYAIRRIFPWCVTNIICRFIGVEVTRDIAIASGIVYNAIALIISILFFFRISNLKKWKSTTEVLGFMLLFFTYPVLKIIGYYPVLSDIFGLTLGIMISYYFFANKKWALIVCGIVGAFVWPTSSILAFALAFFPHKELPKLSQDDKRIEKYIMNLLVIAIACLPLILMVIKVLRHAESPFDICSDYCVLTKPMLSWIVPISCLCTCLYYYYIVSAFKVSLFSTIKENLYSKSVWYNYMWFVLCVIISILMCKLLANSDSGELTMKIVLYKVMFTSMINPFIFVESNFFFYGLGYLLMLFLWKDVAKVIMHEGLGYLFVVATWAFFSIGPEARASIMYWVFPMMALLVALDTQKIRSYVISLVAVFSLTMSLFWFKINAPDMALYMAGEHEKQWLEFPAQRYFMNTGFWQSHEMYAVFMAITVVCMVILYMGKRNHWFVLKSNE